MQPSGIIWISLAGGAAGSLGGVPVRSGDRRGAEPKAMGVRAPCNRRKSNAFHGILARCAPSCAADSGPLGRIVCRRSPGALANAESGRTGPPRRRGGRSRGRGSRPPAAGAAFLGAAGEAGGAPGAAVGVRASCNHRELCGFRWREELQEVWAACRCGRGIARGSEPAAMGVRAPRNQRETNDFRRPAARYAPSRLVDSPLAAATGIRGSVGGGDGALLARAAPVWAGSACGRGWA
jgi:hypothetical protein